MPAVRFKSVTGERLIDVDEGETATGNRVYALAVVRTMRKVRRGFESERRAVAL